MFFDDDAKKIATVIRGRRDAKGVRVSEPTAMKAESVRSEDGEMDGRHVAMQDFIAAHKEGSAARMADAMANFMDLHGGKYRGEAGEGTPEVTKGPAKES